MKSFKKKVLCILKMSCLLFSPSLKFFSQANTKMNKLNVLLHSFYIHACKFKDEDKLYVFQLLPPSTIEIQDSMKCRFRLRNRHQICAQNQKKCVRCNNLIYSYMNIFIPENIAQPMVLFCSPLI